MTRPLIKVVQVDLESRTILLETGEVVPIQKMLKQGGGYTEDSGEALAVLGRSADGGWVQSQIIRSDLIMRGGRHGSSGRS